MCSVFHAINSRQNPPESASEKTNDPSSLVQIWFFIFLSLFSRVLHRIENKKNSVIWRLTSPGNEFTTQVATLCPWAGNGERPFLQLESASAAFSSRWHFHCALLVCYRFRALLPICWDINSDVFSYTRRITIIFLFGFKSRCHCTSTHYIFRPKLFRRFYALKVLAFDAGAKSKCRHKVC